jgi:hypothetical protein
MPGSLFNVVWLKVNVSKFHTLSKMLNLLIFFAKSLALREPFWLLSKPVAVRKDQHRAGVEGGKEMITDIENGGRHAH